MSGKCSKCDVGYERGVCPNCGKPTLASQILQLIGQVVNNEGTFRVGTVVDMAKNQGLVTERAQAYNAIKTLWEWGAVRGTEGPRAYRSLTGKGRRMIEVHATHKHALDKQT